ncbi:MAG: hypothetical protein ABFD08_13900 [Syntrophomonas sp.]
MRERRKRPGYTRIDDPEEMKKIKQIWMRNNFYGILVFIVMMALLMYGKGCGT